MGTVAELPTNPHWRHAVWKLRVGYAGLGVGFVELLLTLSGHTAWILVVGVVIWIGAAIATLSAVARARHGLDAPRPSMWSFRTMLRRDTVRHVARDE